MVTVAPVGARVCEVPAVGVAALTVMAAWAGAIVAATVTVLEPPVTMMLAAAGAMTAGAVTVLEPPVAVIVASAGVRVTAPETGVLKLAIAVRQSALAPAVKFHVCALPPVVILYSLTD
jgi:hypothetical protein